MDMEKVYAYVRKKKAQEALDRKIGQLLERK